MLHVHALPHLTPKALEILAFAGVTMESLLPLTRAIQPPVLRERIYR